MEEKNIKYLAMRYLQILCIGLFVFGALWEGTLSFNLSTPQFFMLYGAIGAIVSELFARLFKKKTIK